MRSTTRSVRSRNFCSDSWPFAEDAEGAGHGLARVALLDDGRGQRVVAGLAVGPQLLHRRHHQREERRQQLLQQVADVEVLLPRLADHRRRVDRVAAVGDGVDAEHRVVVPQRVVAVVVAERPFGSPLERRHLAHQRELARRDDRMRVAERARHPGQPLPGDERREQQLGDVLGQRRDRRQDQRRRPAEHHRGRQRPGRRPRPRRSGTRRPCRSASACRCWSRRGRAAGTWPGCGRGPRGDSV